MAKIKNDKYYTPPDLAEYIVRKTKEIIGEENITEWLEPSAGSGVFLDYLQEGTSAYDIEPEDDRIVKQDYLSLDLEYKQGRCVIGNPPYGNKNNLAKSFCNKSFEIAEYVSFVLPISQLNNTQSIYKYDLIYSEDLGMRNYSNTLVHCCFNVYKRPKNGTNKIQRFRDSEIIEIREIRESIKNKNPKRQKLISKDIFNYDLAICAWGASIGKEIEYESQYVKEFYIKIKDCKYKDKIKNLLLNADWKSLYPMTATPNLLQWQVYKYIKEQISGIE